MPSARLTDIQLFGTLEKKRDHYVVICIDEEVVATSERKHGGVPLDLRWEEEYRLHFRPASQMTIKLFRHSKNLFHFRRPYQIGQHTCNITQLFENDSELELTDDTGHSIPTRLAIKLTIIPALAKDLMKRVDADLASAGLDNTMLANASAHIDDAIAISRVGRDPIKALGPCVVPLGNALKLLVKIMDSVADAHPISKASWTILSATYKAVQAQKLQDKHVVGLAESLREMLGVAREVPDLTVIEGTADVIEEIGRVSLEVASLIDEYTRHSFVGRTAKFQITDDMKTRVDNCRQDCRDLMEKFHTRLGIGVSTDIRIVKDDILADKISAWLNAPDSSQNYNDACKKQLKSTGSWFIDSKRFWEWKEDGRFLCIYGKAGCGKTILCSSIISNVVNTCKKKESSACAYFFFDGRDAQSTHQRHDGFIRSLVRQFWAQYDGIPAPLARLYDGGYQQPSTHALEDVLQQIRCGFTDSYIIIDSLDECTERRELLTWINKNSSSKGANCHLLSTSRPEKGIKDKLKSSHTSIFIEDVSMEDDIKTYIDWRIRTDLQEWDEHNQSKIKEALLNGARGMFRWVALQLDDLCRCSTVFALEEQLASLPDGVDETYERILLTIDPRRREDARQCLTWIAFSTTSLTVKQLAEVVAVNFAAPGGPRYDPRRKYRQEEEISLACSGLITVSDGLVKLAHFSVKEYLVSERIARGAANFFSINEELSHSVIAATSLAYLLHLDSTGPLRDNALVTAPLAKYAAGTWVFHVREGGDDSEHILKNLIAALLVSENALVNWIRLWDPENLQRRMQPRILSAEVAEPLYYASLLGFLAVSRLLLDGDVSVNPSRAGGRRSLEKSSYMRYGNALQAASHEGHMELVDLLLERGADINMPGGKYGCALQAAAWIRHEEMVELLLRRGADVNMPGGEFGCALQAAACSGDEAIVSLLLENGADVDMQGGKYDNALQAAVLNDHEAIRDLLMEKGAARSDVASFIEAVDFGDQEKVKTCLENRVDVNMNIGAAGCPLHLASLDGHTEVVRLLLENDADVNGQAGVLGSPLQAASCNGHYNIVKFLLENHADISAQGGMYGNALMAASINGHDAVVGLLLNHGADVNARTTVQFKLIGDGDLEAILRRFNEREGDVDAEEEFSYPLHAASYHGHTNVVKILLAHGADVNAHGGRYGNALWAALRKRHADVAKLLHEHGATPLPDRQQKKSTMDSLIYPPQ